MTSEVIGVSIEEIINGTLGTTYPSTGDLKNEYDDEMSGQYLVSLSGILVAERLRYGAECLVDSLEDFRKLWACLALSIIHC